MELWTAFVLGVAGSLHCGVMCGPLVLALSTVQARSWGGVSSRVSYHLGRISVYAMIGLGSGTVGHWIAPGRGQRWLSLGLGLVLLAGIWVGGRVSATRPIWRGLLRAQAFLRGRLAQPSLFSQVMFGALNGLLPCGLVYVAAAAAMATGGATMGAAFMLCFGFGTWPVMLGIHLVGRRLPLPKRFSWGAVSRVGICLMGSLLILRGLELGIPYVSPRFSLDHSGGLRCHSLE